MSDQIFRTQPKPAEQKKDEEEGLPDALKGKSKTEIFNALKAEHIRDMAETQGDYARRLEQIAMQPPANPQPQPSHQPTPPQPESEPGFDISNPDEYLDRAVGKRMAPVVQGMVAAGRESGRAIIQTKLPKDQWDRFSKEIESFVDSVNPQMQANPKIYEIAWNFVKGQHADELIQEGVKSNLTSAVKETLKELGFDTPEVESRISARDKPPEESRPSLFQHRTVPPTSTPRSGAEANSRGNSKGKLSSEEKLMCQKFDMTEEEYLTYKAENSDILTSLSRERT